VEGDFFTVYSLFLLLNQQHESNEAQESLAIAKTTARCAQYMGALKSLECKCPRLLFQKFVKGFCSDRH